MTAQRFVSHAQNNEDVVLWRALGHLESGRYIDVGANDPDIDTVTRAFYERGWSGIDVEPMPGYAQQIRDRRPRDIVVEAAISATATEQVVLHTFEGTGLSTLSDDVEARHASSGRMAVDLAVASTTLNDVLEQSGWDHTDIHFLSLDTEGSELGVLQSIDFSRWRPWILLIEATEPLSTTPSHAAWEPLVLGAGYNFTMFDGLSRFYVAEEKRAELGPLLSYPACVFDDAVSVKVQTLVDRTQELERELTAARAEMLAVKGTASWKVTRPLRAARAILQSSR